VSHAASWPGGMRHACLHSPVIPCCRECYHSAPGRSSQTRVKPGKETGISRELMAKATEFPFLAIYPGGRESRYTEGASCGIFGVSQRPMFEPVSLFSRRWRTRRANLRPVRSSSSVPEWSGVPRRLIRLGEVIVHARAQTDFAVAPHRAGRHGNDRNVPVRVEFHPADRRRGLQSIHFRASGRPSGPDRTSPSRGYVTASHPFSTTVGS